jgi:hypothetical protein
MLVLHAQEKGPRTVALVGTVKPALHIMRLGALWWWSVMRSLCFTT